MGDLTLSIRLKADGSDLVGAVRIAKGELDNLGNAGAAAGRQASQGGTEAKRALDDLGATARSLKTTLAGLGLGLGMAQAVREFIEANTAMQGIEATLKAVTGSARGAAAELAYIRGEADRLGLGVSAAAKQLAQLQAASVGTSLAGAGARQVFSDLASAARVLHLSEANLGGVITAATQMLGKQTVAAEELRGQMAERIPGAMAVAAKAMGVTTAQLGDMIEKGQVLAEDFLPKFAATLRESYAAGLKDATAGLQAESQRLSTAIFEGLVEIGEGGALQALTESIRGVTSALKSDGAAEAAHFIGSNIKFAADHLNVLTAAAAAYAAVKLAPVLLEAVSALTLYGRTLAAVATGQAALLTGATGLAGIVSLIGGWPVVIAGAVAALVALTSTEAKAETVSKSYADSIDKVVDAKKRLAQASGAAKAALEAEIRNLAGINEYQIAGSIEKAQEKFDEATKNALPGLKEQLYLGTYGFDLNGAQTAGKVLRDLKAQLIEARAAAGEFDQYSANEIRKGLALITNAAGPSNAALDAAQQRMKELAEKTLPAVKAADELGKAKKDLKLLVDAGRISLDQYTLQLTLLEQHYRTTLDPLGQFTQKMRDQNALILASPADRARAQALIQARDVLPKDLAADDVGPANAAIIGQVNKGLADEAALAVKMGEVNALFEQRKAAVAGNAAAQVTINAQQATYNELLRTQSKEAADLYLKTGQLDAAGRKYLNTQLAIGQAQLSAHTVEYLRNIVAEIGANERLAAATLAGAAAVAEAEKQNRIENEVLRQGEGARLAITAAQDKLAASTRKTAVAYAAMDLRQQIDGTKRLAEATAAGGAAVEEANIQNELAQKLSQLKIASGSEEAKLLEELIRQLHGYAQALEAANAIKGAKEELDRLKAELSLSGEIERVRTRELALYDARRTIAKEGASWTEDEKRQYLELAGAIADTRGELAQVARERELWLEPFKNAIKGIQDAFASTFEKIFSGGIKSFGDLADAAKQTFIKLAAQIATLLVFRPVLGSTLSALGASPSFLDQLGLGSYSGGSGGGGLGLNLNLGGGLVDRLAASYLPGVFSNPGLSAAQVAGSGALATEFGTSAGQAALLSGGIEGGAVGALASQYGISAGQAAVLSGGSASAVTNAAGSGALPFAASDILPVVGSILPGLIGGNYAQAGLGGAGAIAGLAIGGPIGAAIGGFLGNLAGSFFGAKPKTPAAGALYDLSAGTFETKSKVISADEVTKSLRSILPDVQSTIRQFGIDLAPGTRVGVGYSKPDGYDLKLVGPGEGAYLKQFYFDPKDQQSSADAMAHLTLAMIQQADAVKNLDVKAAAMTLTFDDSAETIKRVLDGAASFRDSLAAMADGLDPAKAQLTAIRNAAETLGTNALKQVQDFADLAERIGGDAGDAANAAMRKMVDVMLGLDEAKAPLSDLAVAFETAKASIGALKPVMEELGYTAEEIAAKTTVALDKLKADSIGQFERQFALRATPSLSGADQLIARYQTDLADAERLYGGDPTGLLGAVNDLVNPAFQRAVTAFLAGLNSMEELGAIVANFATRTDDAGRYLAQAAATMIEFRRAAEGAANVVDLASARADWQRRRDAILAGPDVVTGSASFADARALAERGLSVFGEGTDITGLSAASTEAYEAIKGLLTQIPEAVALTRTKEDLLRSLGVGPGEGSGSSPWQKSVAERMAEIGQRAAQAAEHGSRIQSSNDNGNDNGTGALAAFDHTRSEFLGALRSLAGVQRLTELTDVSGFSQQQIVDQITRQREQIAAAQAEAASHVAVPDWVAERRGLTLSATVNDLSAPRTPDQRGQDLTRAVERLSDPMGQVADGIDRLVRIGPTERVQREIRDGINRLLELVENGNSGPIGTSLIGATAGGTQVAGERRLTGT